jgi:predicted enzyme related to lactoylglutathione lyase
MIGPIKTVAVYVEDQQQALEFYTDKLGFEVRRNETMMPGVNWVEVAPKGAETCVVIYPRALMQGWEQMKPSIVFSCADVEATCAHLQARGVKLVDHPRAMPWGISAKIADPDGNEFLLVQPTPG